jgi:hypothetical protein
MLAAPTAATIHTKGNLSVSEDSTELDGEGVGDGDGEGVGDGDGEGVGDGDGEGVGDGDGEGVGDGDGEGVDTITGTYDLASI